METLLSHSFDYLSSHDPTKIRKGLRQVEGLLAQICLSRTPQTAAEKRRSAILLSSAPSTSPPKQLSDLKDDPAFRDFFKLQQGFQWNVAMRLIACLERLMGRGSNGQNDLLIISTLDLLQGILLLHPPSRCLFSHDINMNILLDLLDPTLPPALQSTTLLVLVTALLSHPSNTRTFESQDGLFTITSLFKSRATARDVKLKLVEFLYFYLMPETPKSQLMSASVPNTAVLGVGGGGRGGGGGLQRRESKIARMGAEMGIGGGFGKRKVETYAGENVAVDNAGSGDGQEETRTTEEKQGLLGKYLNNVEDLVEDLRETQPFGTVVG
ncbi:MAG: hypothetical protein Q9227_003795 [Pyrenula ochraceoflavens]